MERFLFAGRRYMYRIITSYMASLRKSDNASTAPSELQRRFVYVRLRFNALLSDFDTFADVMTQRSESPFGVWLAGLDVAASNALRCPWRQAGSPAGHLFISIEAMERQSAALEHVSRRAVRTLSQSFAFLVSVWLAVVLPPLCSMR
jgi:hypothetical protein